MSARQVLTCDVSETGLHVCQRDRSTCVSARQVYMSHVMSARQVYMCVSETGLHVCQRDRSTCVSARQVYMCVSETGLHVCQRDRSTCDVSETGLHVMSARNFLALSFNFLGGGGSCPPAGNIAA